METVHVFMDVVCVCVFIVGGNLESVVRLQNFVTIGCLYF